MSTFFFANLIIFLTFRAVRIDNGKPGNHTPIMNLSELLDKELLLPKIDCTSGDELIRTLVERIYEKNPSFPIPKNEVLTSIAIREQIGGTLLPSGLSIPHARLKDYEDFTIAIATPEQPLFQGGQQIRMMALMITSQSGVPWYLSVLAAISKISRDAGYFTRLCGAPDAGEFFNIIAGNDLVLD